MEADERVLLLVSAILEFMEGDYAAKPPKCLNSRLANANRRRA